MLEINGTRYIEVKKVCLTCEGIFPEDNYLHECENPRYKNVIDVDEIKNLFNASDFKTENKTEDYSYHDPKEILTQGCNECDSLRRDVKIFWDTDGNEACYRNELIDNFKKHPKYVNIMERTKKHIERTNHLVFYKSSKD